MNDSIAYMQKTVANQNAAHDHSFGRNTLELHALLPLPMALCLRLFFLEIPRECHVASTVNLPSFFFVPSPVAVVYFLFWRACLPNSFSPHGLSSRSRLPGQIASPYLTKSRWYHGTWTSNHQSNNQARYVNLLNITTFIRWCGAMQ